MKIAMLSDSTFTPTGYANVTLELLNRLSDKGHECYNLAHNYHGATNTGATFEDNTKMKYKIVGAGNAPYFQDRLPDVIKQYKFDVIIVLLDTFMMKGNPYQKSWFETFDFSPCKTIFYFPSDGRKFPLHCETILQKVDLPIAMAKYGQQQVFADFGIKAHYIPHGINPKVYYPEDKAEAKQKLGVAEKFVVGVVARNQGRKMLDRTIKAFAQFSKNKNDAVLLMHTDPYDQAQVCDLTELIKEFKLEGKVKFTGMRCFNGFTLDQLRTVYNAMDCFLLTTSGEGFGIPTIEAMACEVPVMLTNYTTSSELTSNGRNGILIDVQTELVGTWNVDRAVMDINHCSEELETLYIATKENVVPEELTKGARQKVLEEYNWDLLADEWEKTLLRLID